MRTLQHMPKKHTAYDTIPAATIDMANVFIKHLADNRVDLPNVISYVRHEAMLAVYKRYRSIGKLCRQFNISRATAYRHFKNPYLGRIREEYLESMEERTGPRKGV